jgi:hypothetical protein
MAKVTVYPRKRWDITRDAYVPGNTLCTREYFDHNPQQQPLLEHGVEVESSQLDGDGCIPVSKLPART